MKRFQASRISVSPPGTSTVTDGSVLRSYAYELACANVKCSELYRLNGETAVGSSWLVASSCLAGKGDVAKPVSQP